MKISFLLFFFFLLNFANLRAQYTLFVEAGFSDYVTDAPNDLPTEILDGFANFEPIFSWRASFDRRFEKEKLTGILGITFYEVGARNFFYEEWYNSFWGVHLGAEYRVGKFYFGLHTYPAVRWYSSIYFNGFSRKQDFAYNIDINPSVSYAITEKLAASVHFSYGINKTLQTSRYGYRLPALRAGLRYELFRKK